MRKTRAEQFWAKVDKSGGAAACWPWTAARRKSRGCYGVCQYAGRFAGAHRIAYELANGAIPEGMYVCHSCDNPPCCNPAHLWLGTNADNQRDSVAKGRHVPPKVKLSADDIVAARCVRLVGGLTYRKLAALFGVSLTCMFNSLRLD